VWQECAPPLTTVFAYRGRRPGRALRSRTLGARTRPDRGRIGGLAPAGEPPDVRRATSSGSADPTRSGHGRPARSRVTTAATGWRSSRLPVRGAGYGSVLPNFHHRGLRNASSPRPRPGRGVILELPPTSAAGSGRRPGWGQGHHMLAVSASSSRSELPSWFVRQREAIGLEVSCRSTRTSPGTSWGRLRRQPHRVPALSDRRPHRRRRGRSTSSASARPSRPLPATLAAAHGAALLPVALYFTEGRGTGRGPPADLDRARRRRLREELPRITQSLADQFEVLIRAAPEQWHLLQAELPSDRG